ncbi:hypothetical protein GQ43DRAFT_363815 [Delitschia confertaspora ATCC 74209]|uniref:Pyridoxal phosphate homeostasis protein n=1 Tax=Delitschia confertaspora ATCC 74209 TaxID=1513339 RepID=A0A9P4MZ23_9PLEO|nr:hypothetical protein GQ43DRAFT_363815 [Delitschia confertaspora ATCC 74209]
MAEGMKIDVQRAKQLILNASRIQERVQDACQAAGRRRVRLIAVSKLKPASDILPLHTPSHPSIPLSSLPPGQRPYGPEPYIYHFGENYVQELLEKSKVLPRSIKWHFIGGLQSNKCKQLAEQIPNLWCVSSVDSVKKADQLEKGRKAMLEGLGTDEERLRVKVQVNTSGEESKSGVEPGEALELCQHIVNNCPHLQLSGLMTIGAIARSKATTPDNENEDFITLRETRYSVAKELGWEPKDLELSMGMSADFEGAIKAGSDEVRVGSEIFGVRPPKNAP